MENQRMIFYRLLTFLLLTATASPADLGSEKHFDRWDKSLLDRSKRTALESSTQTKIDFSRKTDLYNDIWIFGLGSFQTTFEFAIITKKTLMLFSSEPEGDPDRFKCALVQIEDEGLVQISNALNSFQIFEKPRRISAPVHGGTQAFVFFYSPVEGWNKEVVFYSVFPESLVSILATTRNLHKVDNMVSRSEVWKETSMMVQPFTLPQLALQRYMDLIKECETFSEKP